MRTSRALLAGLTVLLLTSCASVQATEQIGAGGRASVPLGQTSADDVVAASWSLGMRALRSGDGPGGVVSPSSLVGALAMLAEGASDGEAAPFDEALAARGQARTDAVNALLAELERYDGDPAVVAEDDLPVRPLVHTAQQVVLDDEVEPAQGFLDRLQQGFGAGVLVTDLGSQAGVDQLSDWVSEQTGGLVERSAIAPDPSTDAVVQDAIVLAAAWQRPFDPERTVPGDFQVPGTGPVTVDLMTGTAGFGIVASEGWQAARLPYTSDLVADVYLPPEGSEAAADPSVADPAVLMGLSAQLDDAEQQPVGVTLPVLSMTSKTDLIGVLEQLGIAGQDLTAIRADGRPVVVTQAVQQAVLEVAEDGTKAAAVTEVAVGVTAVQQQPPQIRLDRPFLLVVTDVSTGWPLFIASVVDPRQSDRGRL
jgi:serine protease inhibitor